jgi:valine--pyruvate aminotransferase
MDMVVCWLFEVRRHPRTWHPDMSYQFSQFGQHLGCGSGIGELMDDLGHALASGGPDLKMLGGGQPARIPEINAVWRRRLHELMEEMGGLERALTTYDPPGGNPHFIQAIATLFRETFGWELGPENVGVTSGGQTAFYFLFNLLAGPMPDGSRRKICSRSSRNTSATRTRVPAATCSAPSPR